MVLKLQGARRGGTASKRKHISRESRCGRIHSFIEQAQLFNQMDRRKRTRSDGAPYGNGGFKKTKLAVEDLVYKDVSRDASSMEIQLSLTPNLVTRWRRIPRNQTGTSSASNLGRKKIVKSVASDEKEEDGASYLGSGRKRSCFCRSIFTQKKQKSSSGSTDFNVACEHLLAVDDDFDEPKLQIWDLAKGSGDGEKTTRLDWFVVFLWFFRHLTESKTKEQNQVINSARFLDNEPEILLLDEPTCVMLSLSTQKFEEILPSFEGDSFCPTDLLYESFMQI